MANPTMAKFGYPASLVAETAHWSVLLRPQAPTLGSLVLVCREAARSFADLSPDAFADLKLAVTGIERVLREFVAFERINYLMLMMVDPDVHFHVIPRYAGERRHGETRFPDAGWPGPPALGEAVALGEADVGAIRDRLAALWNAA
ncbi:HIT family protein [Aureimonas leprariae]|uniref:HIT family protein n=1 Tax=Plantimonas leprariae TaxID=2615207 RepID=A0A7V7TV98_9HYPH|nr:HIT family protein [Aureimonas leprariae]KAB0677191.1 HIT family protein [Aureimonas leprariae]